MIFISILFPLSSGAFASPTNNNVPTFYPPVVEDKDWKTSGYFTNYFGDPKTGQPCDPYGEEVCVRFIDASGYDCNPITNTINGVWNKKNPAPAITKPCKPSYIPTDAEIKGKLVSNKVEKITKNPFLEGMVLWLVDPQSAIEVIVGIFQIEKMGLAAFGFIVVWLGAISLPLLVVIIILTVIWYRKKQHYSIIAPPRQTSSL